MLTGVFDVLFGCTHKRLSFPRTANPRQRRSEAASITGTYTVCLDCGREFAYDWTNMKIVTSRDQATVKTAEAPADLKAA
jgi:DNA-directed RNA polymerase subunit RPC12/RpoP